MSGMISYTQLGGKSGKIGPIPSFLVQATSMANIGASSTNLLPFTDVVLNVGNCFDTSSKAFTAPVTGYYQLNLNVRCDEFQSAAEYYRIEIQTTTRTYRSTLYSWDDFNGVSWTFSPISVLADMNAGNTAIANLYQNGGSNLTDLTTGPESTFSGHLVTIV